MMRTRIALSNHSGSPIIGGWGDSHLSCACRFQQRFVNTIVWGMMREKEAVFTLHKI